MKLPHTPWTEQEWQTLRRMARAGHGNKQIALAMGRPLPTIAKRTPQFRPFWRRMRAPRVRWTPPPPPLPTIRITSADVVAYYALGWRFVGFEEGTSLCLFVWPHAGEVRYPVKMWTMSGVLPAPAIIERAGEQVHA